MSPHPQTIQIFLPSGDPQGIRVAGITTRIVRVLDVPRSLLADFFKMPEAQQVGLYFLVGQSDSSDVSQVYIGQTGSLQDRLASHNQKKEFWNRALVAVSLTNNLTSTHASFLEWLSIQQANVVGRYALENGNAGSRPYTPPPLEAECMELHDTVRVLLTTLGYPIFEPLVRAPDASTPAEYFYCRSSGANGKGQYTEEGFVVMQGSTGRIDNVPSIAGTATERFRQKLVADGVMAPEGGKLVFVRDHLFRSPSMAASALMGRSANGWVEWKNESGATLDALKRQGPNDASAST